MGKKYLGRVSHLIQRKVTELMVRESQDERLSRVTITGVSVNRDTTRAEIYYSIIGTPEEVAEVQAALDGAAGWMRAELAPTLRLRNIPHLVFVYDPSLEYGERIDALLDQWHKEEETDHANADSTESSDDAPEAE